MTFYFNSSVVVHVTRNFVCLSYNMQRYGYAALLYSVRFFSTLIPELIAVLKGNAVGHGSVAVARCLQDHGVNHFAIATTDEGKELRNAGIHGEMILLGKLT